MGQGFATVCAPAAIFDEFIRWTVRVTVSSCVFTYCLLLFMVASPHLRSHFFGYVLAMYVSVG